MWKITYIRCYYCLSTTPMKISLVKTVYGFIVLCGIAYAFVALRGPNGIPALLDKRRQVQDYEAGNEQMHREIEQKQERIERLRNDPREQEIEIRQRLKFAGHGEKIFIIDDKKK
jgi:cell division protein FtsB